MPPSSTCQVPCQSGSATTLTPFSMSQASPRCAVLSVRSMGLATMAASSGAIWEKRARRLSWRGVHCSRPSSVRGGSRI